MGIDSCLYGSWSTYHRFNTPEPWTSTCSNYKRKKPHAFEHRWEAWWELTLQRYEYLLIIQTFEQENQAKLDFVDKFWLIFFRWQTYTLSHLCVHANRSCLCKPAANISTPNAIVLGKQHGIIVLYDEFSGPSSHPFSSNKEMGAVPEAHHWWHQSALPPSARGEKWKAKDCPLFHSQTYEWWSSQAQ